MGRKKSVYSSMAMNSKLYFTPLGPLLYIFAQLFVLIQRFMKLYSVRHKRRGGESEKWPARQCATLNYAALPFREPDCDVIDLTFRN